MLTWKFSISDKLVERDHQDIKCIVVKRLIDLDEKVQYYLLYGSDDDSTMLLSKYATEVMFNRLNSNKENSNHNE